MRDTNNPLKAMIKQRFLFFVEVILVFIGIFLFSLIPRLLLPTFLDTSSFFYGPLYFLLRAIAIILAIPLFLLVTNFVIESQKREIIIQEDTNPSKEQLKLYKITRKNFKYQLLYGILFLFLLFIPLDFLIYFLIPEMIDYSVNALTSNPINAYLNYIDYSSFLISVIIIQICVSIYEETLTRGFITKRGNDYIFKVSAVITSSFYFGLGHFAYFFDPISINYPFWFPFIWFLQTFIVGIILSLFVLRKKWLFPVIFAHALNNIISAHTLWNYPNDFISIALYLYFPLLIISLLLGVWQFRRIKDAISIGLKDLRSYFSTKTVENKSKGAIVLRILIDLMIGILIFGLAIFIAI
ncbi:MAG: CPBP family intramembrane metalloprotease [Candidatus Lokiarchaeota archaeon]|nr:CPBP family intramembrane metalloprotease [Candidatus Lokiarchaeota archaeon]MBD3201496.1 CPBP family intramembrane metalloprotease [Candidatus Lokiarchaeota archaeon]